MTEEQNIRVLSCRKRFHDFVAALKEAGARVAAADFEERHAEKLTLEIVLHAEVAE